MDLAAGTIKPSKRSLKRRFSKTEVVNTNSNCFTAKRIDAQVDSHPADPAADGCAAGKPNGKAAVGTVNGMSNGVNLITDHDAFVQAFAVPTHLYRYLAQRHKGHPLFLHKCLSYMTAGKVSKKPRRSLDEVIQRLKSAPAKLEVVNGLCTNKPLSQQTPHDTENNIKDSLLDIVFEGFFDSEKETEWKTIQATANVKVVHTWTQRRKNKRGEATTDITSSVPLSCNLEDGPAATAMERRGFPDPAALTSSGSCSFTWEQLMRSTVCPLESHLVFHVAALERRIFAKLYDSPPSSKRRRSSRKHGTYPVAYLATVPLCVHGQGPPVMLLVPGQYELRMDVVTSVPGHGQQQVTEGMDQTLPSSMTRDWLPVTYPTLPSLATDNYAKWPRLRFRVDWRSPAKQLQVLDTNSPPAPLPCQPGLAGRGRQHRHSASSNASPTISTSGENHVMTTRLSAKKSPTPQPSPNSAQCKTPLSPVPSTINVCASPIKVPPTQQPPPPATTAPSQPAFTSRYAVTYRFLFAGRLQQWTEARDLVCPWCRLDCGRRAVVSKGAEALLAHLRASHSRFRFKAHWSSARDHLSLEVGLNETFDAANDCGLRRWAGGQGGSTPTRPPVQRLPYTHLVYWRGLQGRHRLHCLDPTLSLRPLAVGHNRQYYHTWSALPVRTCEFDVDSEGEDSHSWLYQHYYRKIEDFTDVNKGEKRMMQLWNNHLLSRCYLGDNQVGAAVDSFIREMGPILHAELLRSNLILHLINLSDYGLLSPELLERALADFDLIGASASQSQSAS